ncbi:hypothetical protein [Bradyrhizobium sp. CCBAU 51765]|uniref:hypothetical protein n=1 Tax=Bradyrhizobium sp. CCBAU 51765 TaxID=1325102 RepID=UPI001887D6C1|nr:hypothetical protein [Bradyrhizobium sp. CCBAU 51765]QOZ09561.1 hypothetical protein XH96_19995 [Bradyrhizobium sp. CCBAU 51765]
MPNFAVVYGVALTALLIVAQARAADENESTYYTSYIPQGFPAVRENPQETRSDINLKSCRVYESNGSYVLYVFEGDALRKLDRFGVAGLDVDDRKWISAYDNRKAACQALMKRFGGGTYLDQAKAWLREWLR